MFKYLTIDNFDLSKKTVGIRLDLNLPIIDGKLVKSKHFIKSLRTIKELLKKDAKIIILGHQGRFGYDNNASLKDHGAILEEELKTTVSFVESFNPEKIEEVLNSQVKKTNIVLLENVRFLEDEVNYEKEDNIVLKIQEILDFYILEDFSLVHNNQTTIAHFNKIPVIAGRTMEKELNHLNKINDLKRPRVYVFGGIKVKDEIDLIKKSIESKEVDKILLTGTIGELALLSRDYKLGKKEKTLKKEGILEYLEEIGDLIKKNKDIILFPSDIAIFDGKNRIEIDIRDFDMNDDLLNQYEVSDIGMKTVIIYEKIINEAGTIYLKGPAGKFEEEEFEKGSKELMRVICNSKAFSFMGGGHSTVAANMFNMIKQFSYVSSAGTALIGFLSGKELPGLNCLSNSFEKFYDNQFDFIVIGSNSMDIKADVPEKLSQMEMGGKIKLDNDITFNTGGGGVNVSIAMSNIGPRIGYLGKVSTESKELLINTLNKNSISLIPTKETRKSAAKSILLQTADNDRLILTYRGHNSYLNMKDICLDKLKSNNFYFASLNDSAFETQVELAKQIKERNKYSLICFNPSSHLIKNEKEKLKELIALTNVLIFNFDEAKELTGEREVEMCLRKIYDMGPNLVVITDGVQGTNAFNGRRIYFQQAKEAKKIVDTTGAGDCFAATFFYFYAKGYGVKSSLLYASLNSANLISKVGTSNGLLSYNELVRKKRI